MNKKICVYCGSQFGLDKKFAQLAENLGETLVKNNLDLVYGGGRVGLMGTVSQTVMKAGGHVSGVIPQGLFAKEVADESISQLYTVGSMHERKALMEKLSDGFLAIPGGWGTLDEFFEILTWAQIGIHKKPIGILNYEGFFDPLLEQMNKMTEQGFVKAENAAHFFVATSIQQVISEFKTKLH